jgi:hypothetical protein
MDGQRRWATWTLGALMVLGSVYALFNPTRSHAVPLEQTSEFTPEGTRFVNPFITPSPSACPPTQDFKIGDIVVLTGGVLIRYAPDPSAPFIASFPDYREFVILNEVVCYAGFNWYGVQGHGIRGWVSEGTSNGRRIWLRLVRAAADLVRCETPLKLVAGERFNITNNVRMRETPDRSARTLTVIPYTAVVTILEGPVCAGNINWWKVRATVVNVVYDGWIAESVPLDDPFIIVPTRPPCDFPLRLRVGEQARVLYGEGQPKRLRSAPTTRGAVLAELINNVPVLLLDGPVCSDTYNWWKVRVLSSEPIEGWLAEGGPGNYWIAPISDFREP